MHRYSEKGPKFLDLNVSVFQNKKNGQLSLTLPKRQLKKILDLDMDNAEAIPKKVPIRIFKWRK